MGQSVPFHDNRVTGHAIYDVQTTIKMHKIRRNAIDRVGSKSNDFVTVFELRGTSTLLSGVAHDQCFNNIWSERYIIGKTSGTHTRATMCWVTPRIVLRRVQVMLQRGQIDSHEHVQNINTHVWSARDR